MGLSVNILLYNIFLVQKASKEKRKDEDIKRDTDNISRCKQDYSHFMKNHFVKIGQAC